jgi:hypothetical protein
MWWQRRQFRRLTAKAKDFLGLTTCQQWLSYLLFAETVTIEGSNELDEAPGKPEGQDEYHSHSCLW